MALLPLRVFAYSSCDEFYETKRLTQIDLLSARIPQMGFEVNGAFNMLKKTREMFWSGRRDLNSGPPAPKAGALPGCATPRQLLAIDSTALLNFLSTDLAPTVHELCKLARILRHCAQSHESSK